LVKKNLFAKSVGRLSWKRYIKVCYMSLIKNMMDVAFQNVVYFEIYLNIFLKFLTLAN